MSKRGYFLRLRQALHDAQLGVCYLCGEEMLEPTGMKNTHPLEVTIDHIIPRSMMHPGQQGFGNFLGAHCRCNNHRHDEPPDKEHVEMGKLCWLVRKGRVEPRVLHAEIVAHLEAKEIDLGFDDCDGKTSMADIFKEAGVV